MSAARWSMAGRGGDPGSAERARVVREHFATLREGHERGHRVNACGHWSGPTPVRHVGCSDLPPYQCRRSPASLEV
jgi:hypothetical protein